MTTPMSKGMRWLLAISILVIIGCVQYEHSVRQDYEKRIRVLHADLSTDDEELTQAAFELRDCNYVCVAGQPCIPAAPAALENHKAKTP